VDALKKEIAQNQYDYIIHAAGITKAATQETYDYVNAGYAYNLATAAAAFPVKRFVFISSLAAIGPTGYSNKAPIDETYLPRPLTGYGRSKLLAEEKLLGIKGLPLVILRPTAVYGPRERDIFIMFKTLRRGLEPYIGRKPQHLSFVYVKDLAEITIKALTAGDPRRIYHVSDGKFYDRYKLADISKRILGRKTLKFHVPRGVVNGIAAVLETFSRNKTPTLNKEKLYELTAENWNCSIDKIQQELGFQPKYDLEHGLEETLQWYKENKWL
jgi:nucleoside-diphosphate-sugar epimerase